jgi:sorbitol/mannitol transport system substrate-binding protein
MQRTGIFAAGLLACVVGGPTWAETTLTIATVNNNDMIVMQRLSGEFEQAHPDVKLNWVVLEENVLRERLTTDIATNSGQYDILTIGLFEAPMWGEREWLVPFDNTPADYEIDDVIKSMRDGLSHDGKLFALPFYGESQMTPLSQGSA